MPTPILVTGAAGRVGALEIDRREEFADFAGGKPGDKALHETCFACHIPAKDHDYVFTRYPP
jgi:Cytochrome P460